MMIHRTFAAVVAMVLMNIVEEAAKVGMSKVAVEIQFRNQIQSCCSEAGKPFV